MQLYPISHSSTRLGHLKRNAVQVDHSYSGCRHIWGQRHDRNWIRSWFFLQKHNALLTAGCFPAFAITVCRSRNIEMIPALLISGANISLISLIILGGDLSISFPDLLLCILLGSFVSAIPNAFFITASRYLIAAELTLFMLLEFVLVPILVRIFIKEISGQATLICEVIVIIVVLLRVWFEMRESRAL